MRSPAWIVAIIFAVASLATAQDVPYLAGRVNDLANLLDAGAETRLDATLMQLEQDTGVQVVVLTLPSLEGGSLEEFSQRVAETWGLGRDGVDDGVLFLIARDDRKMRLEVGYGLEGVLTDARSRRILDDVCRPRFRQGDFEGGIISAVEVVDGFVRGEDLLPPQRRGGGGPRVGPILPFLVISVPFAFGALFGRGAQAWVIATFLTVFWYVIAAVFVGPRWAFLCAGVWVILFLLLRFVLRKPLDRVRESVWWRTAADSWSSGSSGGTGGGFSGGGGGFSGGGGSFGGGGASSSW